MAKDKYYSIGEAAKNCKIPIQTLRYYDEIKLLVPCQRKETSNYRYYSEEQLVTGFIIRQLRMIGLGLKDIKKIVEENTTEALEKLITAKLIKIEEEIKDLQRIHDETEIFAKRIKHGESIIQEAQTTGNDPNFRIRDIGKVYLFGNRTLMKSYRNEDVSLERWIGINEEARAHHFQVRGPIFVTYHTELFGQFLSKDCDLEFSIQVEADDDHHKMIHSFGGFKAATATHVGDYDRIFKTYIELKRWIEDEGYEIIGPVTEEFIVSPIDINNKDQHVTEIIIPVKKV